MSAHPADTDSTSKFRARVHALRRRCQESLAVDPAAICIDGRVSQEGGDDVAGAWPRRAGAGQLLVTFASWPAPAGCTARECSVMRLSRRRFAGLAAVTLVMPGVQSARARQVPSDFLPFLNGLRTAYARRYMPPPEFVAATPATSSASWLELTVLEFETASDAIQAGALLNTDLVLPVLTGIDDLGIEDFDDAGLGDRSFIHVGRFHDDVFGTLLIFDGNLGFVLRARGSDFSIEDDLLRFGAFAVEAEPGGEVVLSGYGQSSGGTWDTMPTAGDTEVLAGLVPLHDYDLLVSVEPIEPEASPVT